MSRPGKEFLEQSTSYLIKQKGRRSDVRQKFIGCRDTKRFLQGRAPKTVFNSFLIFQAIKRIRAKNTACKGVFLCHNRDKHPGLLRSEILFIESKVVKELEKKKSKSKREFDVFKAGRENVTRIFFWCDAASTEEKERRQIRRHERT